MKKKKTREEKKSDMPEFSFRQFTAEEDRVYEEAIKAYRAAVEGGKKLKETYETYVIADAELRAVIQADFLKIMIAERHFNKREPLESLAASLAIPLDLATDTMKRMLQEVGITSANQFGQQIGDLTPKAND